MSTCNVCLSEGANSFEIHHNEKPYIFDCFECAIIYELAPVCSVCGCIVIAHGIEINHDFYCSVGCLHSCPSIDSVKIHA